MDKKLLSFMEKTFGFRYVIDKDLEICLKVLSAEKSNKYYVYPIYNFNVKKFLNFSDKEFGKPIFKIPGSLVHTMVSAMSCLQHEIFNILINEIDYHDMIKKFSNCENEIFQTIVKDNLVDSLQLYVTEESMKDNFIDKWCETAISAELYDKYFEKAGLVISKLRNEIVVIDNVNVFQKNLDNSIDEAIVRFNSIDLKLYEEIMDIKIEYNEISDELEALKHICQDYSMNANKFSKMKNYTSPLDFVLHDDVVVSTLTGMNIYSNFTKAIINGYLSIYLCKKLDIQMVEKLQGELLTLIKYNNGNEERIEVLNKLLGLSKSKKYCKYSILSSFHGEFNNISVPKIKSLAKFFYTNINKNMIDNNFSDFSYLDFNISLGTSVNLWDYSMISKNIKKK